MKRRAEDYERLIAELAADADDLERVAGANAKAEARIISGAEDELDYGALGYTIHNLYGVIENYCLRIAKFFENGLDPVSWHRDLLKRMTLDIPGVRPALFDRGTLLLLDELRAFRHIFRHLYAQPLDREKALVVQRKVAPALAAFRAADILYRRLLSEVAEGLR